MKEKKKLALSTQIFIALVLAIIAGIAFTGDPSFATGYIKPFGTIFLNLIKWIVGPLVFFSIMAGVVSMRDIKKVGAIGGKTVVYYLCTTAFAVAIGLLFANIFKGIFPVLSTTDLAYEPSATSVNFMDTLVGIFPSNFVKPFVDANMLQIIVASLIIGFALILISENNDSTDFRAVDIANEICMKAMEMIIKLSPIGVFCLLCPVVAENGPSVLGSLLKVLLVAYLCYILHAVVIYSASVKLLGGLSPVAFFKGMMPAIMMAFSSASSVGTLPLNLECTEKLGADKEVASFVLPLGATINMDGTAIYQGAADADDRPDGDAGLHRHGGCSRRGHGHAGDGAAVRRSSGGRHRACRGRGPHLRYGQNGRQYHRRRFLRDRCFEDGAEEENGLIFG